VLRIDLERISRWADSFGTGEIALERLAAAIFVNTDNPESRLMALFTAYVDASGNAQDQPFVVVSGYIANFLQWKLFEGSWSEAHRKHDVEMPFHMTAFIEATTHPQSYALQKNARPDYVALAKYPKKAESFLWHLCRVQEGMVNCGFSCIVEMGVYRQVNANFDLRSAIPPYALGARTCLALIHGWEANFDVQEPVECIFEKGDFEQGKFTELLRSEGYPYEPIYKPKAEYAGLQAADMYAWEQANCKKKELRGEELPYRDTFNSLLINIPKLHGIVTEKSLLSLCREKGIDPRTGVKK